MKKLIKKFDIALFKMQCAGRELVRSIKEDERGVSPIIATVIIILLAVGLAIVFKDYIAKWLDDVWTRIFIETDKL